MEDNWFLDGFFAFAYNDYDQSRHVQFPGIDRTAEADFGGQQWSWKLRTGYDYDVKDLFTLTPVASLQYTYLRQSKYTESGAGALSLSVDSEGYHFLHQGLGVEVAREFEFKKMSLKPSIHAMWIYEYVGDKAQTTANFSGGGAAFNTTGAKPAQNSIAMGGEIVLATKSNVSLVANYDLELKDEFWSHTYTGTVRYSF